MKYKIVVYKKGLPGCIRMWYTDRTRAEAKRDALQRELRDHTIEIIEEK